MKLKISVLFTVFKESYYRDFGSDKKEING